MNLSVCYGNRCLFPVSLPKPTRFSQIRNSKVRLRFEDATERNPFQFYCSISFPKRSNEFLLRAAASSSPLGGYSEGLEGAGLLPEPKTRKIAGIDQEEIEDPALLADPDSCFCEFNGVRLHHKISAPDSLKEESNSEPSNPTRRVNFPIILLHGFGASSFSWNRVMKPLAQVTSSKVLAFDRPAFGFTSRVDAIKHSSAGTDDSTSLNPYSVTFSAMATHYFIDLLAAEKAILVGHSAGALVAVDAYFCSPERVAALILVAPAIFAPFTWQKTIKGDKADIDSQIKENDSNSTTGGNVFSGLCNIVSRICKYLVDFIVNMVKGMTNMINILYKKALSTILRSAIGVTVIRMIIDKFGIPAIRAAWYDPNQATDHVLQGYTMPLKIKGWDKALVEFTLATLTASTSESEQPLGQRLSKISCPVLVVTGDTDRLVPVWNSERLSRAIPGSTFELIKKCGHLPQEEKAEEFVSVVNKFLERVFGIAEEPRLQPIT